MLTTATKSQWDNSMVWLGRSYEEKVWQWATQVKNHISRVKTLTINEEPSIRVWWWCDDISPPSSVTFPRNILNNLRYLKQVTISSSVHIRHNFHNFHQNQRENQSPYKTCRSTPTIRSQLTIRETIHIELESEAKLIALYGLFYGNKKSPLKDPFM